MSAYVQSASVALTPVIPIMAVIVTFLIHIEFGYDLSPIEVHTRKELNQDMLYVILSIVFSSGIRDCICDDSSSSAITERRS